MTDYPAMIPFATGAAQKKYAQSIGEGFSQTQTAERYGVTQRVVERSLATLKMRAEQRGYSPEFGQTQGVPNGQEVAGVSTLYDAEGNIKIQWVKSKQDKQTDSLAGMRDFAETFAEPYTGQAKPVKKPKKVNDDLMTVYPLGDPHFGMRAWVKETGIENFDTDIAEADMKAALRVLIESAPESHTGVLLNLGDLFHADNLKPLTPESGHLLDTDGRMSHTIDAAARAFRMAIDLMLKKHKEVILVNVRGNHDPYSSLFFNKLMAAFYSKEKRVTVLDNENKLINMTWGKTLLTIHHTDRLNFQRWYEMVTRDYPELWGAASYRYGLGGHTHHDQRKEIGGLIFCIFQTLAAPDAWHAASGYGAGRSASAITYHKEFGEVHISKCSIEMARAA